MDIGVTGAFDSIVLKLQSIEFCSFFKADRIIYANPCKQSSYIRYAKEVGVETMTFDNEQELLKIHQLYPNAK